MSFEERLNASFRGVDFELEDIDGDMGRRAIAHQYPKRNKGYTEDNGQVLNAERINGKVVGDDYLDRFYNILEAVNKEGPGELIHPWFGVRKVQVGRGSYKLVNRTEGVITFSFEVFDVGENVFPTAKSDTVKVLDDQASVTQEAANTTFENEFDETATTGIGDMIDQYLDDLDEFTRGLPSLPDDLREWTDRLMRAKDSIGKLLAYPGDLAREMMGILEDIKSVVTDPIRALEVYDNVKNRWDGMRAELAVTGGLNRNVASKNGVASSVPTVTNQAEKNAILANAAAYQKLIINSATISKASALGSADTTYSFGDEAEVVASLSGAERNVIMTGQQLKAIGYKLAAELAELAETEVENGNSALWRQMRSLRQAVLADTKERAELLPQLTVFTPTVTVPVSLIAWQQTGDTERRNSIVRRNGIRNPAFVTPNDSVEVING